MSMGVIVAGGDSQSFVSPQGAYVGKVKRYVSSVAGVEALSDLLVLDDPNLSPAAPIVTAKRATFYLPDGYGASTLILADAGTVGYTALRDHVVYGKVVESYNSSNEGSDRFSRLYVVEAVDVSAGSPYAVGDLVAVNEQRLFLEREGYAFVWIGDRWLDPVKDFYFSVTL